MNEILNGILRFKKVNFNKLLNFGFKYDCGKYRYSALLKTCGMEFEVTVNEEGEVETVVTDPATGDPFTLFLVEGTTGAFVGEVRADYEEAMTEIAEKCCEKQIFKTKYAERVIGFIRDIYGDELEFLWADTPDIAIWRRKDNRKWYGVIFALAKRKLGLDGDGTIEILDLRINPEETENVIDNRGYFKAYHMNKKHWITVSLEGEVELEEIFSRIKNSYALANKK